MTNPTDRRPSDDEIRNRLTPLQYHVTAGPAQSPGIDAASGVTRVARSAMR
jgi:hypothetical protein